MKIVDRSKLRLVAAALCVASMSFATSCSGPPHVTTTSYYDTQVGATPVSTPDPSAITTIGNAYLAANTTGCFAIPGGQPPPPYPWDPNGVNNLVGSSPDVGQCYF